MYFATELRILLVYLNESLGRLGQNEGGGGTGGHIFHWGRPPGPHVEPPLLLRNKVLILGVMKDGSRLEKEIVLDGKYV